MNEKLYTLEKIKRAYWEEFHASGERWFNYFDSEEENNKYTEYSWLRFVEYLNKENIK